MSIEVSRTNTPFLTPCSLLSTGGNGFIRVEHLYEGISLLTDHGFKKVTNIYRKQYYGNVVKFLSIKTTTKDSNLKNVELFNGYVYNFELQGSKFARIFTDNEAVLYVRTL